MIKIHGQFAEFLNIFEILLDNFLKLINTTEFTELSKKILQTLLNPLYFSSYLNVIY